VFIVTKKLSVSLCVLLPLREVEDINNPNHLRHSRTRCAVGFLDYLDAYCLLINGMKQAVRIWFRTATPVYAPLTVKLAKRIPLTIAKPFTLQRNIDGLPSHPHKPFNTI
jgi:hypothetical protein